MGEEEEEEEEALVRRKPHLPPYKFSGSVHFSFSSVRQSILLIGNGSLPEVVVTSVEMVMVPDRGLLERKVVCVGLPLLYTP